MKILKIDNEHPPLQRCANLLNLDNSTNRGQGSSRRTNRGRYIRNIWLEKQLFAGQLYFLAAAFRACVAVVVVLLLLLLFLLLVVVVVDSWQGFEDDPGSGLLHAIVKIVNEISWTSRAQMIAEYVHEGC